MIDMEGESSEILPSQFYGPRVDETIDQGIRRLFFAVLTDALNVYRRGKREFAEVEEWLRNDREDRGPFSFVSICEALGLEPSRVGKAFRVWRHNVKDPRAGQRSARRPPVVITYKLQANSMRNDI